MFDPAEFNTSLNQAPETITDLEACDRAPVREGGSDPTRLSMLQASFAEDLSEPSFVADK